MDELDHALEGIETALESEDVEEALRLARAARRKFPAEPDVHLACGDVLWEAGDLGAAREAYENAARLAPDAPDILIALGWAQFGLCDFAAAKKTAQRSNNIEANAAAWSLLGRIAEREGDLPEADRSARRAHVLEPDAFHLPHRMSDAEFRATVSEALDRLPDEFRAALDGEVAVLVEPVPSLDLLQGGGEPWLDPELLGLYVGTPLPERTSGTPTQLPDVVYLFQRNLEQVAEDRDELLQQIAITVYHEIGHYLGYDDDELDERGFG